MKRIFLDKPGTAFGLHLPTLFLWNWWLTPTVKDSGTLPPKRGVPEALPTKASVKRAIAGGELTLNGEGAEDSRILHPGDVVQLRLNKVREAQDAGAARARLVRVVSLHQDCRWFRETWPLLRQVQTVQ